MKSIFDSYADDENIEIQGLVTDSSVVSGKDGSKVAKGTIKVDDEIINWVGFNRKNAPPIGLSVKIKGKISTYKGVRQIIATSIVDKTDLLLTSQSKRLIAYYRNCVEKEYQGSVIKSDLSKIPNLRIESNGLIEGTTTTTFLELDNSSNDYNWFKKVTLTGLDTTIMLGYPIIKRTNLDGSKKYAPLVYVDAGITIKPNGAEISRLSEAISWNYGALELLGIPLEERDYIRNALSAINKDQGSDTERLSSGITLIENYICRGMGWDERFLHPKHIVDQSIEIIYGREVCFDGQANSVYEYLLSDLGELLSKKESELKKGPLGVILANQENTFTDSKFKLITPLPYNAEQIDAITKALSTTLSCVTGPPGTGKSQFVANLANTAVSNGLTVLIASKNNQAVDVAISRIKNSVPTCWPIRTGNRENRSLAGARLFEAINSEHANYGLKQLQYDLDYNFKNLNEKLDLFINFEDYMLKLQSELKVLNDIVSGLESELEKYSFKTIADLKVELLSLDSIVSKPLGLLHKNKQISDRKKLIMDILFQISKRYSIAEFSRLSEKIAVSYTKVSRDPLRSAFEYINILESRFLLLNQKKEELESLTSRLDSLPSILELESELIELKENYCNLSKEFSKINWDTLLDSPSKLKQLELLSISLGTGFTNNIKNEITPSLKVAPLWGVTNLSASTSFPLDTGLFDILIVDEASQCDVASILPLLFRAKRAVLVGDPNQLQHITSIKEKESRAIGAKLGVTSLIDEGYNFASYSAFSVCRRFTEFSTTLKEHYRSHPAIAEFANKYVYNGELEICTNPKGYLKGDGVFWHDISGKSITSSDGGSLKNFEEAKLVVSLIGNIVESSGSESIGVVTPFKEQADLITTMISKIKKYDSYNIRVATAHKFQGDERDVIIVSTVISNETTSFKKDFANNLNLINVSVTRARRQLHVVGSKLACSGVGGLLGSLVTYTENLNKNKFESPAEESLYNCLDENLYTIDSQVVIDGIRVDFLITRSNSEIKLIVECDGHPFHRNLVRDEVRDIKLINLGYRILHIAAKDALKNKNKVNNLINEVFFTSF